MFPRRFFGAPFPCSIVPSRSTEAPDKGAQCSKALPMSTKGIRRELRCSGTHTLSTEAPEKGGGPCSKAPSLSTKSVRKEQRCLKRLPLSTERVRRKLRCSGRLSRSTCGFETLCPCSEPLFLSTEREKSKYFFAKHLFVGKVSIFAAY